MSCRVHNAGIMPATRYQAVRRSGKYACSGIGRRRHSGELNTRHHMVSNGNFGIKQIFNRLSSGRAARVTRNQRATTLLMTGRSAVDAAAAFTAHASHNDHARTITSRRRINGADLLKLKTTARRSKTTMPVRRAPVETARSTGVARFSTANVAAMLRPAHA